MRGAGLIDAFDRPYTRHGITLPVYPFRRQSYWPPALASGRHRRHRASLATADLTWHPLLGWRRYSAISRREIEFESRLDAEHLLFLNDHRVFSNMIVPSSVYLEMALAAARDAIDSPTGDITDVQIRGPNCHARR
jgi:acyl transferase domain-containing protein